MLNKALGAPQNFHLLEEPLPSVPNPSNFPGYPSGKFSNQKLTQTPTLKSLTQQRGLLLLFLLGLGVIWR
uniref:Uncharacterized protein n=1 Tax=Nelumbo nucifera TaxID=4432 RepID=A0A822XZX2_NELNU|nr:TPA_asm: hypothetical protein HUJ06_026225 [Nelumbo nucifera]